MRLPHPEYYATMHHHRQHIRRTKSVSVCASGGPSVSSHFEKAKKSVVSVNRRKKAMYAASPAAGSPGRAIRSQPINVYGKAGDLAGHDGSSPRSHRGFLEGFRRRRLQSLNITTEGSLDEDLGFPPQMVEPPSDLVSCSAPGGSFLSALRPRSRSDALNTSPLNMISPKRQSGILVMLPSSPSPANAAQCSPRTSHLSGGSSPEVMSRSAPRPLFVDTQLANQSGVCDRRHSPVSKVVDFMKGRTRTNSLNCTSPQPVPTHRTYSQESNPSPAMVHSPMRASLGRPPVHSRFARAPVAQKSLDSGLDLASPACSHALLIREQASGAKMPPVPESQLHPQSVQGGNRKKKRSGTGGAWMAAARAKASTMRRALAGKPRSARARDCEDLEEEPDANYDTVRSLPASGHYGRRRTGHVERASEEEWTAPKVIILPRRRLQQYPAREGEPAARAPSHDPVFDFEAWQSALDTQKCQDSVYSLFMKAHKCYDLIPLSTKLVVFDTELPVKKAFHALVYNGVRAAPLWDNAQQKFIGMLTITDFIKILYRHHEAGSSEEGIRALEEERIGHWRDQFAADGGLTPLVNIDPNESLFRAVQVLCESKVHRLPVMDAHSGNISYILTHKRIIKFLSLYMHDLPRPAFTARCPRDLGIGSWGDVRTISTQTPLIDALKTFLDNRLSALPLVDEQGRVVNIYAKFDVISLAADKAYSKLDITVHEALQHRSQWFEGVRTCRETDSLFTVLEIITRAEVHRLIVTDESGRVVGIISLSDILKFLVLDPHDQRDESAAAAAPAEPAPSVDADSAHSSSSSAELRDEVVFDVIPEH